MNNLTRSIKQKLNSSEWSKNIADKVQEKYIQKKHSNKNQKNIKMSLEPKR